MNAIGYIRISTKDQSRYSLEYQESEVRKYCEHNELNLLALFRDNGQCSDTFDRADWIALEEFITRHKRSVQFLIIFDHDRFSRNLPEALMKISTLEKKFGIRVLATNEAIDTDTSDPSVFLNRAFKYLIANHELIHIRKRTKMGIRQALENGRFVNMAPFGYLNKRDETGKGIIVVDKTKAYIIKKIFDEFLAGNSIMQIFREVKLLGFPVKGNSAIQRVLEKPVYAGLIKFTTADGKEKIIRGIHQPIISEFQYWTVQQLLSSKNSSRSVPKADVPLRGILKCWCGMNMTAANSKGRSKYYTYYRCMKHSGKSFSAGTIHEKIREVIRHLSFTSRQTDFIKKTAMDKMEEGLLKRNLQLKEKEKSLKDVIERKEKLEEKYMNDEIEATTYKKWFRKYAAERETLKENIKMLRTDRSDRFQRLFLLFPYLENLLDLFDKANLKQKHDMLKMWFKQTLMFNGVSFETAWLNPAFSHNYMVLKEKGLLFVKQSGENLGGTPVCTRDGN